MQSRPIAFAAAALFASFAFAAPPAAALEESDLRAEVETLLDEIREAMSPALLEVGTIDIVPAEISDGTEGFRVTLGDVAVVEGIEDRRMTVGTLALTVAEAEPDLYVFEDLDFPRRMEITERGAEAGWAAIDIERFSGTFSATLGEFVQLDYLASALELRVPQESLVVGAALLGAIIETQPEAGADGLTGYDAQHQRYRVEGLIFSEPESTLEIDELSVEANIGGLDLRLYETLLAVLEDVETAAEQGDTSRLAALRQALAETGGVATSATQYLSMAGITVYGPEGQLSFRLDSLSLSAGGEAPRDSEFGSASLALAGSGLSIDPTTEPEIGPYIDLVPESWNIPLTLEHLPVEALTRAMVDVVFALAADPLDPSVEFDSVGIDVLDALGTAGSYLIIRDLFIESPLLRLDSKASLAFDPELAYGVLGNVDLTLTGLDKVLVLAEGLEDPDAKRILSAIVLGMMGVGEAVALPDGRVGYRFSFFFAPDGSVKMNGFSFGEVLNKAVPQ